MPGATDAATPAGGRRWLIGIQSHKDAPALLEALLRPGDRVRVCALPEHSSWTAEALQRPGVVISAACGEAEQDLRWLVESSQLPVICGSLYLVAALMPLLQATD